MSDRPTPETDKAMKYWPSEDSELVDADFARRLERERDEAREALENHTTATIHTCHSECKRPMCVLRRERDQAREELRQWQTLRLYGAEPEYIHEYIKRLRFDEVNNGNPTD